MESLFLLFHYRTTCVFSLRVLAGWVDFFFLYLSLSGCCWFLLLCAAGLLQRIYTYIFWALRSGCFLSPHIHFLYIITRRNLSECWINFEGADKWLGPRRAWHSSNMFLWSEIAIANVYFVTYNISIKNPFINLPDRGFLSVAHTHIWHAVWHGNAWSIRHSTYARVAHNKNP